MFFFSTIMPQRGCGNSRRRATMQASNRNQNTVPPPTYLANGAAQIAFQTNCLCFLFATFDVTL